MHAWYVVVVLLLANAVSFIDRLLLSLLVTPIKTELQLSDTQVSLLQGFAFALFYCFAGLALARLADRSSRKWIVTAGLVLWCLLTSLSGTAMTISRSPPSSRCAYSKGCSSAIASTPSGSSGSSLGRLNGRPATLA